MYTIVNIRIGPLICILWGPLTTIVGEILGPPFLGFLDELRVRMSRHR